MDTYNKNPLKSISFELRYRKTLKLCVKPWESEAYQICSSDHPIVNTDFSISFPAKHITILTILQYHINNLKLSTL